MTKWVRLRFLPQKYTNLTASFYKDEAVFCPLAAVFFLGLSLILRLSQLSTFITSDEYLWISRSRHFSLALLQGNLLETFQTGHPGVTTMWSGSLGLWLYNYFVVQKTFAEMLLAIQWCTYSPDILAFVRWPVVVLSVGCLGLAYFLLEKLFGPKVALISLVLLCFSPFYTAHSRFLHHDALVSSFMLVASLSLGAYVWHSPRLLYLYLSAGSTALALLTKSTALFLFPFSFLLFGLLAWFTWQDGESGLSTLKQTFWRLCIWGSVLLMVFFLLWPVLWVDARYAVTTMWQTVTRYAATPHEQNLFFWGQVVDNPGLAYYGLTFLFRLTPLALGGLMLAVAILVWQVKATLAFNGQNWLDLLPLILVLCYVLGFILFLNLGAKKQGRYILPAMLMVNVLAGWGLYQAGCWLKTHQPKTGFMLGLSFVFVLQFGLMWPHHPYYLTYYNPLLGGGRVASAMLTMGWGEGLDEAARYLNKQPEADTAQVATWLVVPFGPYFQGRTLYYPQAQGLLLGSDYAVLYISEIQRGYPDAMLHDYIRQVGQLEQTITLKGIDYAWIYRMPDIKPLTSRIYWSNLLAYSVQPQALEAGQEVGVTFHYRGIDAQAIEDLSLVLQQKNGDLAVALPFMDYVDFSADDYQFIQTATYTLSTPADLIPGTYQPNLSHPPLKQDDSPLEPNIADTALCGTYLPESDKNLIEIY